MGTNHQLIPFIQVEQTLPLDEERQTYVASLTSPHTGVTSLPCIVTGTVLR